MFWTNIFSNWILKIEIKYYSGAHISWHELFLAEKQGNYQNLDPSMLTYKFWLIFMGMKQKQKKVEKKKIKMADSQKLSVSILNIFSRKF